MLTCIIEVDNVAKVTEELWINPVEVPHLSQEQKNLLAQLIDSIYEVRRATRKLKTGRKVTKSRAPRLLHDL